MYREEGRNKPLTNAVQCHLLQISAPTEDSTQLLTGYKQHILWTLHKKKRTEVLYTGQRTDTKHFNSWWNQHNTSNINSFLSWRDLKLTNLHYIKIPLYYNNYSVLCFLQQNILLGSKKGHFPTQISLSCTCVQAHKSLYTFKFCIMYQYTVII